MVNDDERREVARRLREMGEELGSSALLWYHIAKILGVRTATDGKTACDMLADLIEPGSERTCHIKLSKTSVWHCDGCGQTIDGNCFADNGGRLTEYRYCPNCGAKVVDA